jgi:hypothetical protein
LLIGERLHLLATKCDCTDQLIVLEHWDGKHSPISAEFRTGNRERMPLHVGRYRRDVGDVGNLLRDGHKPQRRIRGRSERATPARRGICGRCVVQRNGAKSVPFAEPKRAEFGLTNASGIRWHRLEHWLQFSGRSGDDAQHLRGRGLLLQRLGESLPGLSEFAGPDFELPFQLGGQ